MKFLQLFMSVFFLTATVASAQSRWQTDSVIILKNDDYSNFKNQPVTPYIYQAISSGIILSSVNDSNKIISLFSPEYFQQINKASFFFEKKDFANAILFYSSAININNGISSVEDRYNLANCYAAKQLPDSAFAELNRVYYESGQMYKVHEIETDQYFKVLHADKRWQELINRIRQKNKRQSIGLL